MEPIIVKCGVRSGERGLFAKGRHLKGLNMRLNSKYQRGLQSRYNLNLSSPYKAFFVEDLLDANECENIIQACEQSGFENLDKIFPQVRNHIVKLFSQ